MLVSHPTSVTSGLPFPSYRQAGHEFYTSNPLVIFPNQILTNLPLTKAGVYSRILASVRSIGVYITIEDEDEYVKKKSLSRLKPPKNIMYWKGSEKDP